MTASETARLAEWLKMQGFTDAQVVECINFIAYGKSSINKPSSDQ